MKRFDNRTLNLEIVGHAINRANELFLPNSPMMNDILNKDDFKFNSGLGIEVHSKIANCKEVSPVFFFKSINPWTASLGYSDGKAIYLNSRKFSGLNFGEIVGLLAHEYLHIAGFGHGNNYKTKEKCDFSVNYFVSENIAKWI